MFSRNVFARAEYKHLKRVGENPQGRKLWWLLLVCNLIFAAIPFLATDHYADVSFYTIIGLCLIAMFWGYALYVITLALGSIDHEKHNQTWDSLVLTGVAGNRIVFGKWLAIVRYTLGTSLLLTITKLATAYSVMQYLNVYPSWLDMELSFINRPFVYMSYSTAMSITPIAYYPQIWQVVFAFVILEVLSLAEIALLSAFGLLGSIARINWSAVKLGCVCGVRIILSMIGIGLLLLIGYGETSAWLNHKSSQFNSPWVYDGCDSEYLRTQLEYYAWCVVERDHRRIFETAQVAASALVDNGVLLAANIMRPIGTFQFALRNLLSAVITLLGLILLTTFSLLAAGKWMYRRAT